MMYLYRGNKIAEEASQLYYHTLVESTLLANLTATQLIGNSSTWMQEVTTLQATTIRRTYGAGTWCPSTGLLIEVGWRPTIAAILEAKLGLYDRIAALPDHEYAKHVQNVRRAQVAAGKGLTGLDYEVACIWSTAPGNRPIISNRKPKSDARRKDRKFAANHMADAFYSHGSTTNQSCTASTARSCRERARRPTSPTGPEGRSEP